MSAPKTTFLQSRSLTAGQRTVFDAPSHPGKGILRGYLVRVLGTIVSDTASSVVDMTAMKVVLDSIFTDVSIQAPRYNNQLCSGSLTGKDWLELYETKYLRPFPLEIDGTPIDQDGSYTLGTSGKAFQFDIFLPFEEPKLGADRMLTCPPAHLFRGDVALAVTLPATLTADIAGTPILTLSAMTARWMAVISFGDQGRVPLIHRFEKRTYATDSFDLGRGIPSVVLDKRAPSDSISYEIFVDGQSVNESQVTGEDLTATYGITSGPQIPEPTDYTPIRYVAKDATVNELEIATQSLSLKLTGASSGTILMNLLTPPDQNIQRNVALAVGADPMSAKSVPVTPNNAPLGQVYAKIALNGPRTMLADGVRPVNGVQRMAPTVPAGSNASVIAASITGKA